MSYITKITEDERAFGQKLKEQYTATAGQTVFPLTNYYALGTNTLEVYINGVKQAADAYTETSNYSVTFSEGLSLNDLVEFVIDSVEYTHVDDGVTFTDLIQTTGATLIGVDNGNTLQVELDDLWSNAGSTTGGGNDKIFALNDQVVTTSYSIPAGKNAMTAGPITINDGVTVTIPNGSTWKIV